MPFLIDENNKELFQEMKKRKNMLSDSTKPLGGDYADYTWKSIKHHKDMKDLRKDIFAENFEETETYVSSYYYYSTYSLFG